MLDIQEIDGNVLEGGGQILRMSISLSAVLNIPVRVKNIRAGREKPGLAAQHLKGIQLVAEMCQAQLKGAYIGSTEIEFIPGKIRGGHYTAHTRTAGSISLLLQVCLPCALFADGPVVLDLKGGTNADMAPQIDYMEMVFRRNLNKFGGDFNMQILKRGKLHSYQARTDRWYYNFQFWYFPRGGGHVRVEVTPVSSLRGITLLERGVLQDISGISFVSGNLPLEVAYEMADSAKTNLTSRYRTNIRSYKEDKSMSQDKFNGIVLWCSWSSGCVMGASALGGRGVRAGGEVGRKAGEEMSDILSCEACLDQHTQDQLIVYMCLAECSRVLVGPLTLHTRTAIHVADTLAGVKFEITPQGQENIVECTGRKIVNKSMQKE